jgi:hypothetical protein
LADTGPRRVAVRALAGVGLATVAARIGAEETSAGKKRCRKIGQRCRVEKNNCCPSKFGEVSCVEYPEGATQVGECLGEDLRPGFRCCGQLGVRCDPNFGDSQGNGFGNCSCCPPLFCGRKKKKNGDVIFRCQAEDT